MAKKIIYFVRHGESFANTGEAFEGPDSGLTDLGKKQAKVVGERLSRLPVEVVLASTFKRAEETALLINSILNKPIVFSDLFRERRTPTSFVGKIKTELRPEVSILEKNYGQLDYRYEDAENGADLMTRAREALDFIVSRPENNIVVVTHGFFLRCLVADIFGLSAGGEILNNLLDCLRHNNTGITVIEYNDSNHFPWTLRAWNDHSHLSEVLED